MAGKAPSTVDGTAAREPTTSESAVYEALMFWATQIQGARLQRRTTLGVHEIRELLLEALDKVSITQIPMDCIGQVVTHILAELDRRSEKTGWECRELRQLVLDGFEAVADNLLQQSGFTARPETKNQATLGGLW